MYLIIEVGFLPAEEVVDRVMVFLTGPENKNSKFFNGA